MKEEMSHIIKLLRCRALIQKIIASFSILGVLIILCGGLYIFIFESPKIAAQDIEQQRKISTSEDIISKLSDLNFNILKNNEDLNQASSELIKIESAVNSGGRDGNYLFGEVSVNYYLKDFNLENESLNKYRLLELDSLLNNIEEASEYFNSDEAKIKYIESAKEKNNTYMKSLESSLQNRKNELDVLKTGYRKFKTENPDINESIALKDVANGISYTSSEIDRIELELFQLIKKMNSEDFQKNADAYFETMLDANKTTIEKIHRYKPIVEEYLDRNKEKQTKQNSIIKDLKLEKADLSAREKYFPLPSNETGTLGNDTKMAFYVSTNIARFGVIVVTIFFAQLFLSIYRYSTKVSHFYHARADSLEILTQTGTFQDSDLPKFIEMFSNVLTPDKVDFGKSPEVATNEVIKILQSVIRKD